MESAFQQPGNGQQQPPIRSHNLSYHTKLQLWNTARDFAEQITGATIRMAKAISINKSQFINQKEQIELILPRKRKIEETECDLYSRGERPYNNPFQYHNTIDTSSEQANPFEFADMISHLPPSSTHNANSAGSYTLKAESNKKRSKESSKASNVGDRAACISYQKVSSTKNCVSYQAFDSFNKPVSVLKWTTLMIKNPSARSGFVRTIKKAPFRGMFMETMGVNLKGAKNLQFSFVLINSPALHAFGKKGVDHQSFAGHFKARGDPDGVAFDNLGRDALLIAPRPPPANTSPNLRPYSHLAKFVREAPGKQVDRVFAMVAHEYLRKLQKSSANNRPVWLSTSGLGVAWLHFRLDSSPKYYQYKPFIKALRGGKDDHPPSSGDANKRDFPCRPNSTTILPFKQRRQVTQRRNSSSKHSIRWF